MKKLLYVFYCLLVVAVAFTICELLVRFKGDRPFEPVTFGTAVEPGGKLYEPQARLGYTHVPGHFKVTLHDGYQFSVTHLPNHHRVTHPLKNAANPVDKPGLWIFGCSLTYGWAINDQDTFAWLLQEKFPQYEVDNFGVSGYGTVHAYQQITEALKTRAKPKIIIIAYGSFHDTRNVCSRHYRKAIIPHADLGNLKFLWARFDREGRLVYSQEQAGYTEVPFMRYSAFIHRLEESYNRRERETLKHHEVSRAVMADVIRLCREQGITILVAGLQADDITSQMLACAKEQGAYVVDIAVDLKIKENTNLPHDGHPSPKANREYAARLAAFLQTTVFPTPSGKK